MILRCEKNPAESCGNGLELAQRLNIAIDVAQAITYLHEYKGTKLTQFMFYRSNQTVMWLWLLQLMVKVKQSKLVC